MTGIALAEWFPPLPMPPERVADVAELGLIGTRALFLEVPNAPQLAKVGNRTSAHETRKNGLILPVSQAFAG